MAEQSQPVRAFLSPVENVAIGVFGGCLETTLQMPLLTWKLTSQEGRALPITPAGWYRGLFSQAGSVAPITAVQVVANGVIGNLITGGTRNLTDVEKILGAIAAGGVSSIIYSPADMVTIHQQKMGTGPLATLKHLFASHGLSRGVFRGMSACAGREAIYTCGYLGLTPVLATKFRDAQLLEGELKSNLAASLISGITASLLSHPIDTAKTVVQADVQGLKYPNTRTALVSLYRKNGIGSLYKGGLPRVLRSSGAFFIVGMLREKAIQHKTSLKDGQGH